MILYSEIPWIRHSVSKDLLWTIVDNFQIHQRIPKKFSLNYHYFFDREQRSKVLKEALLFFFLFLFLLAWNQVQKMLQMWNKKDRKENLFLSEQKMLNFKGNKKFSWTKVPYRTKNFRNENCSKLSLKSWFQSETKTLIYAFLAICWHVRQHGLLRNNMSLSDLLWSCMEFYGLLWSCVALYRRFMVFHGFVSLFLAVIDSNSFVLLR